MPWSIELEGRVAVLTMNTNSVNAQNQTFFSDLHNAIDRLELDYPDCPVVLTSDGEVFSAGIDFKYTFPIFARSDPKEITAWFEQYRETNLRLFSYHRPVISAINGHAIAGGLITALAGDYRICVDSEAKLGLNEVPVGITMPSVYIELIRYACGNRTTALATLFGELYTPHRALDLGFIHQVVPKEELRSAAITRANLVPDTALDAFAGSKRALLGPVLETISNISSELDRQITNSPVTNRSKLANAAALSGLSG